MVPLLNSTKNSGQYSHQYATGWLLKLKKHPCSLLSWTVQTLTPSLNRIKTPRSHLAAVQYSSLMQILKIVNKAPVRGTEKHSQFRSHICLSRRRNRNLHLLRYMGFGSKYYIIHAFVNTNGQTFPRFDLQKGTRQGCPLSSLTFFHFNIKGIQKVNRNN